jgi:hypothetical protein
MEFLMQFSSSVNVRRVNSHKRIGVDGGRGFWTMNQAVTELLTFGRLMQKHGVSGDRHFCPRRLLKTEGRHYEK